MSSQQYPESLTGRFCVSLLPQNEHELKAQLSECGKADLIEIRLDWLEGINQTLFTKYKNKQFIAAIRTKDEGGFFTGSLSGYINIYQQAIDAGFNYIDVSYQNVSEVVAQLRLNDATKVVLSSHTNEREIDPLRRQLQAMSTVKADVYKLVFSAKLLGDNITALNLIDFAKELRIPFVIHAQGEEGKQSRILGSLCGNTWTYVSLDENQKTAPGQLNLDEAASQYYLQEKNSDTRIVGLTGYPLAQSKGWKIFNRLFYLNKVNAIYLNFPVEDSEEFWHHWQDRIDGLSVTIPHKEYILKFISHKSKEVEASGVCNTLLKRGGVWEAHNTDLLALVKLLEAYREKLDRVLIYGTGATTRSAISALQRLGAQNIFLAGRNKERGKDLAEMFSITFLNDRQVPPNLTAIMQTTPVGMHPNVDDLPACASFLREEMLILDVVHNPPVTKFMRLAKDRGCTVISGREMYLHQAVFQYELFTGDAISVDSIRKVRDEL